jgi:hypothetical protein
MDERLFRLWLRKLESGKYKCNKGAYLKTKENTYSAAGVITEHFIKKAHTKYDSYYDFNGYWSSLAEDIAIKLGTTGGLLHSINVGGYSALSVFESKTIKESITALKKLLSLN